MLESVNDFLLCTHTWACSVECTSIQLKAEFQLQLDMINKGLLNTDLKMFYNFEYF